MLAGAAVALVDAEDDALAGDAVVVARDRGVGEGRVPQRLFVSFIAALRSGKIEGSDQVLQG
jgi:hypothetical protein